MFAANTSLMRFRLLLMPGLLSTLVVAPPARAQHSGDNAPTTADRAAIEACIRESQGQPRACIGTVAVICAREGSGDRREAEIACTRREAAVWRERLDLALRALAQRLDSGPRNRLAAVQRSWEEYSALRCAFMSDVNPPGRAELMQAGCELRAVAGRAIELAALARRVPATDPSR